MEARGWKQSALVWAVVRGLNESRQGRLPARVRGLCAAANPGARRLLFGQRWLRVPLLLLRSLPGNS